MKPIYLLLIFMGCLFTSCSTDSVDDNPSEDFTVADLSGEFRLYYDNQGNGTLQGPELLDECEGYFLIINSGNIQLGEFEDNCERYYVPDGVGTITYISEYDKEDNAIVVEIKAEEFSGKYVVEYWKDEIYMIYPHGYSIRKLTSAGYWAGYWKRK